MISWHWIVVSFIGGGVAFWLAMWGMAILDQWDERILEEERRKSRE